MLGVASSPTALLANIPQCRSKLRSPLPQTLRNFPSLPSTTPNLSSTHKRLVRSPLTLKASVGSMEFVVEPGTKVKFPTELTVPGCSKSLVLLGTGYREKVFAIIGVKVYAAGFYAEPTVKEGLYALKVKSAAGILEDPSTFSSIFQAPVAKSLMIVLVRDVDGKTFWNALDDVISPRIREPTALDESALSTFRDTIQGCDLKQGTFIFLTWPEPSKMLVTVSSSGNPSNIDAVIESSNVSSALFDAFFGGSPVSPTLKGSVADGLRLILN